jgi:hypothetical protein|tara:strand:+ start:827 stop:1159 length:333 start_codon:yes stop_codon:yes gene_type:complete
MPLVDGKHYPYTQQGRAAARKAQENQRVRMVKGGLAKREEESSSIDKAFRKMDKPASEGGTGGTFTAAATKAGFPDSKTGRTEFANKVLNDPKASTKMKRKANFYKNVIV